MLKLAKLQFNPYGENTYILSNDSGEAMIIDPGMSNQAEQQKLSSFVEKNNLKPVMVVATHGHVDHVCGALWAVNEYGVPFAMSAADNGVLTSNIGYASNMGFDMEEVPVVSVDLSQTDHLMLGDEKITVIPTPGHTSGGVSLYLEAQKILITGDTLFKESIGRTDLPSGDYKELMGSIMNNILPLGGDVMIFPGHGPDSTLSSEAQYNPFVTDILEGNTKF